MQHSHIQKWGNSLGVRIPIQLAKKLNLQSGSPVILKIAKDQIVIQPVQYDLESMLKQISPKNSHHLLLDNQQVGKEEW